MVELIMRPGRVIRPNTKWLGAKPRRRDVISVQGWLAGCSAVAMVFGSATSVWGQVVTEYPGSPFISNVDIGIAGANITAPIDLQNQRIQLRPGIAIGIMQTGTSAARAPVTVGSGSSQIFLSGEARIQGSDHSTRGSMGGAALEITGGALYLEMAGNARLVAGSAGGTGVFNQAGSVVGGASAIKLSGGGALELYGKAGSAIGKSALIVGSNGLGATMLGASGMPLAASAAGGSAINITGSSKLTIRGVVRLQGGAPAVASVDGAYGAAIAALTASSGGTAGARIELAEGAQLIVANDSDGIRVNPLALARDSDSRITIDGRNFEPYALALPGLVTGDENARDLLRITGDAVGPGILDGVVIIDGAIEQGAPTVAGTSALRLDLSRGQPGWVSIRGKVSSGRVAIFTSSAANIHVAGGEIAGSSSAILMGSSTVAGATTVGGALQLLVEDGRVTGPIKLDSDVGYSDRITVTGNSTLSSVVNLGKSSIAMMIPTPDTVTLNPGTGNTIELRSAGAQFFSSNDDFDTTIGAMVQPAGVVLNIGGGGEVHAINSTGGAIRILSVPSEKIGGLVSVEVGTTLRLTGASSFGVGVDLTTAGTVIAEDKTKLAGLTTIQENGSLTLLGDGSQLDVTKVMARGKLVIRGRTKLTDNLVVQGKGSLVLAAKLTTDDKTIDVNNNGRLRVDLNRLFVEATPGMNNPVPVSYPTDGSVRLASSVAEGEHDIGNENFASNLKTSLVSELYDFDSSTTRVIATIKTADELDITPAQREVLRIALSGPLRDSSGESVATKVFQLLDTTKNIAMRNLAIADLAPTSAGSFTIPVAELSERVLETISDRIIGVRDQDSGLDTAALSPLVAPSFRGVAATALTGQIQTWGQLFATAYNADEHSGVAGYTGLATGMAVGIDAPVTAESRFGAAYSYAGGRIKGRSQPASRNDVLQHGFSVYGHYDVNGLGVDGPFMQGMVGFAFSDNQSRRRINTADAVAGAHFSSRTLASRVELGYRLKMGHRGVLEPFLGVRYTSITTNGYSEDSGGLLALRIDKASYTSFESALGGRMALSYQLGGFRIQPSVRLVWVHDFLGERVDVTARYLSQPSAFDSFSYPGRRRGREGFVGGIGLSGRLNDIFHVGLDYDSIIRSDQNSHQASVTLRYAF